MKRILFIVFACLLTGMSVKAQSESNVVDEIIWVVGEEAILRSDVEVARLSALSQHQTIEGDPYCVIPENLAINKLFLHQAAIDSIEVADADVMQAVESHLNSLIQRIGSKEKVEEYFGRTMSEIREQSMESFKESEIIRRVQQKLISDVKVTPAQVRQYFKNMPEDSIPFIPTMYEVQILVRNPIISQEEIDRVKNELRGYTERINSGASQFSTLALLYSEDKGSASHGGELGFMSRSELVPEYANVAFNLTDTKTVSKIVESEFGFHIIQLIEKRGDRINTRHILRTPQVSDEALTACISQVDSIMDGVNRGEYTFEEAISHTSQDKNTRANNGLMVRKMEEDSGRPTTKFELRDLPAEVARKVASMEVGEYSKPFVMINDNKHQVVAVVRLKSKVAGHRATMRDDYQSLQSVLMAHLGDQKIDKWIRDMQKKTYIRIKDGWKNCEFRYPGWIK